MTFIKLKIKNFFKKFETVKILLGLKNTKKIFDLINKSDFEYYNKFNYEYTPLDKINLNEDCEICLTNYDVFG